MLIGEAVTAFLAGYFSTCKRSAKTRAAYGVDLLQFREYAGPDFLLSAVGPGVMEAWAADLLAKGYVAVSVRRKFATVRVFFAYWVRKGDLDKSPLWKIRLDLGRDRVLPRSLAAADAKRFIEVAWQNIEPSQGLLLNPADPRFLHLRNIAALEVLF